MKIFFSDVFEVSKDDLDNYGAFDIAVITDLPLFVDPFLLFNSKKPEYIALHSEMIDYLHFLKNKSSNNNKISLPLLKHLYCFPEVEQNKLGFCKTGTSGRGLGPEFGKTLNASLENIFNNFGEEQSTTNSHLEKLCLIADRVGRDKISDFTTNLIKSYLLSYTEKFAKKFISPKYRKEISVEKVFFNYHTEVWTSKVFDLPYFDNDFVILTPKDILTKDDTWINKDDLISGFEKIPNAIDDELLRGQINNYFQKILPTNQKPTNKEYRKAVELTLKEYPKLIDYFIRYKELTGNEAIAKSTLNVKESASLYIEKFGEMINQLKHTTDFYKIKESSKEATYKRIMFLKDVVENKGGHRFFYVKGKAIKKEDDIHIMYRLTWYETVFDVSREVNDGRGPSDAKISLGKDKTLVEFKLAKSTSLKRNLLKQLEVYKKASDAQHGYFVIVYFNYDEYLRASRIIKELNMTADPNIIFIDACKDNKPSASVAT